MRRWYGGHALSAIPVLFVHSHVNRRAVMTAMVVAGGDGLPCLPTRRSATEWSPPGARHPLVGRPFFQNLEGRFAAGVRHPLVGCLFFFPGAFLE